MERAQEAKLAAQTPTELLAELERAQQLVDQLQQALTSRIAIEQAKGVLSERLACPIDVAFEILRDAARRERMSLRALAEKVIASDATPDAIVASLARASGWDPGRLRERAEAIAADADALERRIRTAASR